MQRLELDDTDTRIGYSGAWSPLKGSSRQWMSTIHSTTQKGAVAAINFQGTRVVVYCTVPIGSHTNVLASVTLDGRITALSRPTNGTAIYADVLFDSGPISDTLHTIILSNTGSTTDSPLQLDRFHLEGTVISASPGPVSSPVSSPTSTIRSSTSVKPTSSVSTSSGSKISGSGSTILSSPSTPLSSIPSSTDLNGGSNIVSLPQDFRATSTAKGTPITDSAMSTLMSSHFITSTEADGTIVTEIVDSPKTQSTSASVHIPNGAIIGCVIGILALILAIVLLLFKLRNRRARNGHMRLDDGNENQRMPDLTSITPFNIQDRSRVSGSSVERPALPGAEFPRNEKTGSHHGSSNPAVIPVSTSVSSPTQSLPNLTFDFGDGSYVFVPRHRNAPSSPTVVSPETPSSVHSTAMHSTTMLLPGESNDLPPSYQVAV